MSLTPRMAFWPAAPDLAPYISGYSLYAVGASTAPHCGAFEPAWASLRIAVAGGDDWRLRLARGDWFNPPRVALLGPSSQLIWSESGAGILVGAGIRPRGWVRLFASAAGEWADRVEAAPMLGDQGPDAVRTRFRSLTDDESVPLEFDALFRAAMRRPSANAAAIGRIERALVDPAVVTVAELAARTELPVRSLQRLAHRAFGFPPKLLLRRARFLRSLHAVRAAPPGNRSAAIDLTYTDYSHFIRDAHDFLDIPPKTFLKTELPLLDESLELRRQVLGAPAQALDAAPDL